MESLLRCVGMPSSYLGSFSVKAEVPQRWVGLRGIRWRWRQRRLVKMPELQIVLLGLVTYLYGYVLLGLDILHGVQFERLGFVLILGVSGLILFNNDCMIGVRFCCNLVCFASFCLGSCTFSFCLGVVP